MKSSCKRLGSLRFFFAVLPSTSTGTGKVAPRIVLETVASRNPRGYLLARYRSVSGDQGVAQRLAGADCLGIQVPRQAGSR